MPSHVLYQVAFAGGTPGSPINDVTAVSTVEEWPLGGKTTFIIFQNMDNLTDVVVSFSQADADAGVGVVVPHGVGAFGNPLQLPIGVSSLWTKASAAAAFQIFPIM